MAEQQNNSGARDDLARHLTAVRVIAAEAVRAGVTPAAVFQAAEEGITAGVDGPSPGPRSRRVWRCESHRESATLTEPGS